MGSTSTLALEKDPFEITPALGKPCRARRSLIGARALCGRHPGAGVTDFDGAAAALAAASGDSAATAADCAAGTVLPKLDARMMKSLLSTVPLPSASPWA